MLFVDAFTKGVVRTVDFIFCHRIITFLRDEFRKLEFAHEYIPPSLETL